MSGYPEEQLAPGPEQTEIEQDLNIATRTDLNGQTTYHILNRDRRSGMYTEKVYDWELNLVRVNKHSANSSSETHIDPKTGATRQSFEASILPDGSRMTKNIVYPDAEISREEVVVVSPTGELVRRVEREHIGMRTTFQSQTEYRPDGLPATTINHYTDLATGSLTRREQIEWRDARHKTLKEEFIFDESGYLTRYSKVFYHSGAGPFIEETKDYYPLSQQLRRRVLATFNLEGSKTCEDRLEFNKSGKVIERQSKFYDGLDTKPASHSSGTTCPNLFFSSLDAID